MIAYGSLLIMAVLPIFIAARRSVYTQEQLKKRGLNAKKITAKIAAATPLYGSSIVVIFFGQGVRVVNHVTSTLVDMFMDSSLLNKLSYYTLLLKQHDHPDNNKEVFKWDFSFIDIGLYVVAVFTAMAYFITKHWILNNIFAMFFSFTAIEFISLQTTQVCYIVLLGALFFDIFWMIFGVHIVIVGTVLFEAPLKLVFPMDLLEGSQSNIFIMLPPKDIAFPGLFIALLYRYDVRQHPNNSRIYFIISCISYIFGFMIAIVTMHTFRTPQSVLLFLVPACLGLPLATAAIKGELSDLWRFNEHQKLP
ncbi:minor histocompatibility antigen H13-like isoform X2 [Dysidea avara]|uniref:minor histocompatibility antigen H13-like isoform X2 n=1 Tax=Dysidea avara TaxID=196820 RepID=UPI0033336319